MVTIFLSTFNRLQTLSRTLDSFRRFTTPYQVVIVDNGTDHPECRQHLADQRARPEVLCIYRGPRVNSMPDLERNIDAAIRRFCNRKHGRRSAWFAVTDADICFDGSSPDCLEAYISVVRHHAKDAGHPKAAGPHTRVDQSIPLCYPLRSRVLATESRPLYRDSMRQLDGVPYAIWSIDTTFHVFERADHFRLLGLDTFRVGPPYDAMHLDWYIDAFQPSRETLIYMDDDSTVGSWSKGWLRGFWGAFQRDHLEGFNEAVFQAEAQRHVDLNNGFFLASWCLQHGIGAPDGDGLAESVRMLDAAVPDDSPYMAHRQDWLEMIYDNDFTSLGWSA